MAVAQLLENAQSSGVDLVLDTSAVENAMMLDAIERMSLDGMAGRTPTKPIGKLVRNNFFLNILELIIIYCLYVLCIK